MDGDPAVEPELDSFSRTLPLPYRVALIVVLGVWAWGANLHYLSKVQIDVPTLIHYPSRPLRSDPPHHLSTYRLALILTLPLALSLLLFWTLSHRNPTLVIYYDFLPLTYLFYLLLIFCLPLRRFSSAGRKRFLLTLRRISIGGLALPSEGKFGDIILADVLTSYAKIVADLFVSLCMFFSGPRGSATARPDRGCGGQYLVPIIIAVPSIIRLRQCLIDYLRTQRNGTSGGGTHLANALKYASAFPVIILSALQRNLSMNHKDIGLTETSLYRCWLLAVAINSLYSFYWDIAKDWDLHFFSATSFPFSSASHHRSHNKHPSHPLLRPKLHFGPGLYYLAIILDLLLRCTWSLKLSPHLDHFADFESGIFLMEFLEVGRRWMWIFFRVETEWVRHRNLESVGVGGSAAIEEGVLLGDWREGERQDDSDD